MHRRLTIFALAATATLLAVGTPAQTGSFSTFGMGCPSGQIACFASNPAGGTLTTVQTFSGNLFAFPFTPTTETVMVGGEFYMRAIGSPTTVGVYLFGSDSFGRPMGGVFGLGTVSGALASGIMSVGTTAGWYQATFAAPVVLDPSRRYFLAYISNSGAFMMPIVSPGTASTHYFLPYGTGWWNGPFTNHNWAWRVLCAPPGTPALRFAATTFPAPGQHFTIEMHNAPPGAPALLVMGTSNQTVGGVSLPLDLTPMGAPSCSLYVSTDSVLLAAADASGNAAWSQQIPWAVSVIGAVAHAQWFAIAPGANPFGVAASNAGTVIVGQ